MHKQSGPTCFCRSGFTLGKDNRTCEDVNECDFFGICSQTCSNTPGGFICSCADGYTQFKSSLTHPSVPSHNATTGCRANSPDTLMYFATKTEVRGVNLTSQKYFSVARGLPHVIGVGYDTLEGRVYWTDVKAGQESIISARSDLTLEPTRPTLSSCGSSLCFKQPVPEVQLPNDPVVTSSQWALKV